MEHDASVRVATLDWLGRTFMLMVSPDWTAEQLDEIAAEYSDAVRALPAG